MGGRAEDRDTVDDHFDNPFAEPLPSEADINAGVLRMMRQGDRLAREWAMLSGEMVVADERERMPIIIHAIAVSMAAAIVNQDGEVSLYERKYHTVLSDNDRIQQHVEAIKETIALMRHAKQESLRHG